MGNINSLYANLNAKYQKRLAKQYSTGPDQLKSWIENITYTRNHLAHYMRIYNYNFGRTPKSCDHHKPFISTGRIYDQVVIMGFMFSDNDVWDSYVIPEIKSVFDEYQGVIDLKDIGFPDDWEEQLYCSK